MGCRIMQGHNAYVFMSLLLCLTVTLLGVVFPLWVPGSFWMQIRYLISRVPFLPI
jgi:hypothetical protein